MSTSRNSHATKTTTDNLAAGKLKRKYTKRAEAVGAAVLPVYSYLEVAENAVAPACVYTRNEDEAQELLHTLRGCAAITRYRFLLSQACGI